MHVYVYATEPQVEDGAVTAHYVLTIESPQAGRLGVVEGVPVLEKHPNDLCTLGYLGDVP